MFHDQTGPVYDMLDRLRAKLAEEGIEYVVIGAFALGAHNYRRATTDADLVVRRTDWERFRSRFVGKDYQAVEGRSRRFYDPAVNLTFDLLIAGEFADRTDRNKLIKFPDPSEAVEIDGLPMVTLATLVELKLVTWRLKDWADVVALIRANNLDESFAQQLNPLVRMAYLECYDNKVEEDRYDRET